MATDLVGIEKIKNYILKSGRHDFSIRRPGQSGNTLPIFESENSTPKDAAEVFGEWAEMAGAESNSQVYEISVYDSNTDKNKNKAFKSTFQLCEFTGRKGQRDEQGNIIINHPASEKEWRKVGYQKSDIDAAVAAALEKVTKDRAIEDLAAQVKALTALMQEEDEEEDEEEEEEEEENQLGKPETWTPEAAQKIIGLVKDAVMEIKGSGKTLTPGENSQEERAVAGPSDTAEEIRITQDDLNNLDLKPAYIKTPDKKDQMIKMNLAIVRIHKLNGHIGDDLMRVAEMAEKNFAKFKGVILSLRDDNDKL